MTLLQPSASSKHGESRALRVAMVWNGAVQDEKTLRDSRDVVIGASRNAVFPLPADATTDENVVLFRTSRGGGYQLQFRPDMGGFVWKNRKRRSVQDLAAMHDSMALEPEDYGLVTLGSTAYFFEQVKPIDPPPHASTVDGASVASFLLSAFVHGALLVLLFLAYAELPPRESLELSPSLVAKFMVVPPPADVLESLKSKSGTETADPGLKTPSDAGGKKHERKEGKVGKTDSEREPTEVKGEPSDAVAAKVRSVGLLGAITGGGKGNVLADALDVPDVQSLTGGLNSSNTWMGRGSSGYGLRGASNGGGGKGKGALFGAGKLAVGGIGAGTGTGAGRGAGGLGAPGKDRGEVKVSVQTGKPTSNGFLSPEQIDRVVRAHQAAIRYCYEVEVQRQPKLRGRIEAVWRVNLQGGVSSARVGSSTMKNPAVEGCIVRQIRRWQFPKPDGGECVVSYPFIFGLQGGG
jgi:hypothetical protein